MVANAATNTLTCQVSKYYTFIDEFFNDVIQIIGILPGGIELPFNGCHVNACDNLSTGDCSVEVGEQLVYEMAIEILPVYPTIEIEGKWMLRDDSGENFMCFTVPMKIEA